MVPNARAWPGADSNQDVLIRAPRAGRHAPRSNHGPWRRHVARVCSRGDIHHVHRTLASVGDEEQGGRRPNKRQDPTVELVGVEREPQWGRGGSAPQGAHQVHGRPGREGKYAEGVVNVVGRHKDAQGGAHRQAAPPANVAHGLHAGHGRQEAVQGQEGGCGSLSTTATTWLTKRGGGGGASSCDGEWRKGKGRRGKTAKTNAGLLSGHMQRGG